MKRDHPRLIVLMLPALLSCMAFAAVAEPTPQKDSVTGIEGLISEGPIFAGPSNHGQPDSRPLPSTEFVVKQDDNTVTSFKTDEQGRFRVVLPAGHYTVWSKGREGNGGNCSFEVDVAAGEMKKVQWNCDTGLR